MPFSSILSQRLQIQRDQHCFRSLNYRKGVDFASNDYLGFSEDPVLKRRILEIFRENCIPLGSAGSRLLRGELEVFEESEKILADFCGRETAVIYASGYQANVGLLSSLLRAGDCVFSDEANHASIIDGIRLSGAHRSVYPHCDLKALRRLLEQSRETRIQDQGGPQYRADSLRVIVTESLFSMDGDIAPLVELTQLAREFSALLVVDEAHATGLWGDFESKKGGGLVQSLGLSDQVFATIHPAGKAMGLGGAWVCGDLLLKEYLVNFSRSFIFSTAPLPLLPLCLVQSVNYWKEKGIDRAHQVLERASRFQDLLREAVKDSLSIPPVSGQIIPLIVGNNLRSLEVAQEVQQLGFDVRAIRPPTVPEGRSRLRIAVNWSQTEGDYERFIGIMKQIASRYI